MLDEFSPAPRDSRRMVDGAAGALGLTEPAVKIPFGIAEAPAPASPLPSGMPPVTPDAKAGGGSWVEGTPTLVSAPGSASTLDSAGSDKFSLLDGDDDMEEDPNAAVQVLDGSAVIDFKEAVEKELSRRKEICTFCKKNVRQAKQPALLLQPLRR